MLALGPGQRGLARAFLARAFNPRPEASPARDRAGLVSGRAEKSPTRPGPKSPGRPADFLDFFLFFKRNSNETDLNDDLHIFLSFGLLVLSRFLIAYRMLPYATVPYCTVFSCAPFKPNVMPHFINPFPRFLRKSSSLTVN